MGVYKAAGVSGVRRAAPDLFRFRWSARMLICFLSLVSRLFRTLATGSGNPLTNARAVQAAA